MFITGIYMTQSDINSKFVEFLNDAYAAENAAIDRINSRIEETPFPELRQRLEQHLQETPILHTNFFI